jgi:gliding motility-associated-like protein
MDIHAQCPTNTGREFYVSYLVAGKLHISSTVNTSGTVSNPNTGFVVNFTVAANDFTVVPLPAAETMHTLYNNADKKGFIVKTADPVVLMTMNGGRATSDAALVYPVETLGTEYLVSSWGRTFNTDNFQFAPTALIVATKDSTFIEVIPTAELSNNHPANVPFTIKLNRGETYAVSGKENISGTRIRVTNGVKPIAVFCGQRGVTIPLGYQAGDHIFEQVNPVNKLGKIFISPVLKDRGKNILLFSAAGNNSIVKLDGNYLTTLNRGETFRLETNNTSKYIESSQPIQVALFGTSYTYDSLVRGMADPTFMIVQPVQQMVKLVNFIAPVFDSIKMHKVCIIVYTSHVGSTLLDGNNIGPAFSPVPGNSIFSMAALDINAGRHAVSNDKGLVAYAHGYGFRQAYGYCAGAAINAVFAPTEFSVNGVSSADTLVVNICKGQALFDVMPQTNNSSYSWNFGDGTNVVNSSAAILQQVHEFKRTGDYTVLLTVTNCTGETETRKLLLKVYEPDISFLHADTLISRGSSITLFPLTPQGAFSYHWQPNYNISDTATKNPVVTPLVNTSYLLKVTDTIGCTASAAFYVKLFNGFFMPNAFTPNADGMNDIFRLPPSVFVDLRSFTIYNRWGQVVFFTNNSSQGWDGRINGIEAEAGTYVWTINYLNLQQQATKVSGSVLMIR